MVKCRRCGCVLPAHDTSLDTHEAGDLGGPVSCDATLFVATGKALARRYGDRAINQAAVNALTCALHGLEQIFEALPKIPKRRAKRRSGTDG